MIEFLTNPTVVAVVAWLAFFMALVMWLSTPRTDRPWPGDKREDGPR